MSRSDGRSGAAVVFPLLFGMLGLVLLPSVVAGVAVGECCRRFSLKWTWTLIGALAGGAACLLAIPWTIERLEAIDEVTVGGVSAAFVGVLPMWLALAPVFALVWQLRRDRRDRLHGGNAAEAIARRVGPGDLWRQRRGHKALLLGAPAEGGMWLGSDEHGEQVVAPLLHAHCTIVGGSGSGKTNTTMLLLEEHVEAGFGFVALDGKGGRDLPQLARRLGRQHGRPVALWNVREYGHPLLDALRAAWNPLESDDPVAIKDRVSATEEQTEPYYRAIADRGLLLAAKVIQCSGQEMGLEQLAQLMEQPALLAQLVRRHAGAFVGDADQAAAWLSSLKDGEISGLRGMGTRLRIIVESDSDRVLAPSPTAFTLQQALADGWLVVFTLPEGEFPTIVPHVARYVIQTVNGVCSRMERQGKHARSLLVVDELSAFEGDQLAATYERTRGAGVPVIAATQSISNFATVGGEKLMDSARDNNELLIVHRQAVPENAEMIASMIGTEEAWEHTHKVSGGSSGLGIRLGLDEPGERARRLTDKFIVHPNAIKALPRGQAVIVRRHPENTIKTVTLRHAAA